MYIYILSINASIIISFLFDIATRHNQCYLQASYNHINMNQSKCITVSILVYLISSQQIETASFTKFIHKDFLKYIYYTHIGLQNKYSI